MKQMEELHERFYDEIDDVHTYAEMAEDYPESKHEYMHLAHQEFQHANDMFEMLMHHAEKKGTHGEMSFKCMKNTMENALEEAKEELE